MNPSKENALESSAKLQGAIQNRRRNSNRLTPRLYRLASALLAGPRTVRELVDIVKTNNAPEYIKQLRMQHGLTIPCEHVKFVTVDYVSSWFGRYHLTESDRDKLHTLVNRAHE